MFEQMLLPTGGTHQTRNAFIAFAGQAVLAAFAILVIPAIFVAQLPRLQLATELIAPPLPPPPPPPPAAATRAPSHPAVTRIVPRMFVPPEIVAPTPVPEQAPMIAEAAPALDNSGAIGVAGGIPGGIADGVLGGSLGGVIGAPPAPKVQAPAPVAAAHTPSQVRVGGDVQAARLMHEVRPAYPPIARQARVAGTVALSATIAPDGTVQDLHVLSGNPLLVDAAVNAVKQWTYRPTYLNGKPVQVLTEVDVRFTLG
jgi:protein TonB